MDALDILKNVEYLVDGSRTKVLKPNYRAYQFAIESSGLNANEIIFIDDQIRNVNGAKKSRLHALYFDVTEPAQAFKIALDLLGVC